MVCLRTSIFRIIRIDYSDKEKNKMSNSDIICATYFGILCAGLVSLFKKDIESLEIVQKQTTKMIDECLNLNYKNTQSLPSLKRRWIISCDLIGTLISR